jgi:cell division protein FtsQ
MSSFASRRLRAVLVAAVLLTALVALGLWLRGSSLVQVNEVAISGLHGRQAAEIRAALTDAALDMTTLRVDDGALRDAVATYPVVRSLRTTTDFPHKLRITVNAYEPVAALQRSSGSDRTAVAFDGTLLRGSSVKGLPAIGVKTMSGGARVTDEATLHAIAVVSAAPAVLRKRVERVYRDSHGLAATVDGGPKLYFGGGERLRAKWLAAAAVLAASGTQGASYVDLRIPEKPVAGGYQPRTAIVSASTVG